VQSDSLEDLLGGAGLSIYSLQHLHGSSLDGAHDACMSTGKDVVAKCSIRQQSMWCDQYGLSLNPNWLCVDSH
jgi:hypothetical protein